MGRSPSTAGLSLKLLARDWRSGELTVLLSALLIAVSALTAVSFLTDRVTQAVEARCRDAGS
jgi:putative ABC transport system permease protein